MTDFAEELARFEATRANAAGPDDIARGQRLLEQLSPEDPAQQVSILARLGGFHLESKPLDPWAALEDATACYRQILVLAKQHRSHDWGAYGSAGAANVLARRYELGGQPKDLELAENSFKQLIEVCSRLGMLEVEFSSRLNYAKLLVKATHGDRHANFTQAITQLRKAVSMSGPEVRENDFEPVRHARALFNLAAALLDQVEEPHAQAMNHSEAIGLLQRAEGLRTVERDRIGRIAVLRALARHFPEWAGADSRAHAQVLAEEAAREADALEATGVLPERAEWAEVAQQQSALYWDMDELALHRDDLVAAIDTHSENITRVPRDPLPLLWAQWVGGYAVLVGRLGIEDGNRELWQRSRSAFADALDAVPVERDPRLFLTLNRELGRVCHQSAQWPESLAANRAAATIGMSLAGAAGTNAGRASELASVTRAIHFAAYAAARLDRPGEAAELAELGRAQWLDTVFQVAAIRSSSLPENAKAAVDEAQAAVLELERREIELLGQGVAGAARNLENYLGIPLGGLVKVTLTNDPEGAEAKTGAELAEVRVRLQAAHIRLSGLLSAIADDDLLRTRPSSAHIREIARQAGFPIAYLLSTAWGSVAIMVGADAEILPLPGLLRSTVQELLHGDNGYLSLATGSSPDALETSLRAIGATLDAHVIGPLAAWCRDHGTASLGLVGLGDVGLLPMQVSTVPAGLDLHVLPSARALRLSQAEGRSRLSDTPCLLTLGDPRSDDLEPLPFAGVESSVFSALFARSGAVILGLSRTPTLAEVEKHLPLATHLHLACHGEFRPFSPLNSVVHLGGTEQLPVESLLRPALKLTGAKLVILSACNSGSGERWRTPDEAIGFPAAILAAGARTVVAAQWEVDDAATLLLMHRFCRELLAGADAARALAIAQRWMMSAGTTEILAAIDQIQGLLDKRDAQSMRILEELKDQVRDDYPVTPFVDPSYWAGFVCVGA